MESLRRMYDCVVKSGAFDNFGYLVHFFVMLDEEFKPSESWQIGFYNKKTKEIESFSVDPVAVVEKSRAFKHDKKAVEPLDLEKVKINFNSAIEAARKLHLEKYKSQSADKVIVILQSLNNVTTWNITLITKSFSVLNIKVDACSGKVYHHELGTLLQWGNKSAAK